MKRKHLKNWVGGVITTLLAVTGVAIIAYGVLGGVVVNAFAQTQTINSYTAQVAQISGDGSAALLGAARVYNNGIPGINTADRFSFTAADNVEYGSLLNVGNNGVVGYLEIPKLNEKIAIYHGTDDATLKKGIGHMQGTSLPIGGAGTHAVLAGHRSEPFASYFKDLDKLTAGDTFTITALGEVLTYEVDQISIIDPVPYDFSVIGIDPGHDYVTLLTCTPYGTTDQRLLVRGSRVVDAQ